MVEAALKIIIIIITYRPSAFWENRIFLYNSDFQLPCYSALVCRKTSENVQCLTASSGH